eukprot:6505071-Pyramimonas_sp.AAC.1
MRGDARDTRDEGIPGLRCPRGPSGPRDGCKEGVRASHGNPGETLGQGHVWQRPTHRKNDRP